MYVYTIVFTVLFLYDEIDENCKLNNIFIRIIYFVAYFSTFVPLTSCDFFPVGLSSLTRHFEQVL